MTYSTFNAILAERIAKIKAVMEAKGKEYCPSEDRLHNFKRGAALIDQTEAQVCVGYMTKQLVSVFDLVTAEARGDLLDTAMIDEKIGDCINYLILLEAILKEEG